MTREEKITAGVVIVVFILILLWLRRGASSTIINETNESSPIFNGGYPIDIPSLTLPPRSGAIIWPSIDFGGDSSPLPRSQYTDTIAGKSTCACGEGTTSTYYDRAPDPPASPAVLQQLYQVTGPAVSGSYATSTQLPPQPSAWW